MRSGRALQGADRGAIVAILRVVVVVDGDRVPRFQPHEQCASSFASKDCSSRVLVGWRQNDRFSP